MVGLQIFGKCGMLAHFQKIAEQRIHDREVFLCQTSGEEMGIPKVVDRTFADSGFGDSAKFSGSGEDGRRRKRFDQKTAFIEKMNRFIRIDPRKKRMIFLHYTKLQLGLAVHFYDFIVIEAGLCKFCTGQTAYRAAGEHQQTAIADVFIEKFYLIITQGIAGGEYPN